jgi:hypothetical protein
MSLLPILCAYRITMSAYFWCEDFSRVRTFNGLTLALNLAQLRIAPLSCERILLRVSKGPSISGNLCSKLDVQDFEKEEGQLILPALLNVEECVERKQATPFIKKIGLQEVLERNSLECEITTNWR